MGEYSSEPEQHRIAEHRDRTERSGSGDELLGRRRLSHRRSEPARRAGAATIAADVRVTARAAPIRGNRRGRGIAGTITRATPARTLRVRMESRTSIAYQPALDGVRALAVAVVLLFHAEVPGFSGGYLGVSVFFTLSGYLITSLLLAEHAGTGSISFGRFYARRVRRLLPASLACLLAIVVLTVATELFDGVADLRREILGSLLQVSNWVFLAGEGSYQNSSSRPAAPDRRSSTSGRCRSRSSSTGSGRRRWRSSCSRARSHRGRTMALGSLTAVFALAAPADRHRVGRRRRLLGDPGPGQRDPGRGAAGGRALRSHRRPPRGVAGPARTDGAGDLRGRRSPPPAVRPTKAGCP